MELRESLLYPPWLCQTCKNCFVLLQPSSQSTEKNCYVRNVNSMMEWNFLTNYCEAPVPNSRIWHLFGTNTDLQTRESNILKWFATEMVGSRSERKLVDNCHVFSKPDNTLSLKTCANSSHQVWLRKGAGIRTVAPLALRGHMSQMYWKNRVHRPYVFLRCYTRNWEAYMDVARCIQRCFTHWADKSKKLRSLDGVGNHHRRRETSDRIFLIIVTIMRDQATRLSCDYVWVASWGFHWKN